MKILIFTDLDGTLLNHYDYSWHEAEPALKVLKEYCIPVIFNSSKTAAEQLKLKVRMDNPHPFICENGAIANIPNGYLDSQHNKITIDTGFDSHYFATPYQEIIQVLGELREKFQFRFRGFNDMEVDELVALTNLTHEQAVDSKQRQASEPFIWKDSEEAFNEFTKHLRKDGLIVTSGGRFYHVMSNVDKGQSIKWLVKQFEIYEPGVEWITIGLGDSHNDKEMLEVVDYPVFINNPGTSQPDMSGIPNLITAEHPGPAGWNQSVLQLVNEKI